MRNVVGTRSGRAGALLILLSVLLLAGAGLVYLAQPAAAQTVPTVPPNGGGQGLVIVKQADPADDTPFRFLCTQGGVPDALVQEFYTVGDFAPNCDFTLMDPSHDTAVLGFGAFYISEVVPPGWSLEQVVCYPPIRDTPGPTTGLDLQVGQGQYLPVWEGTVTCTFYNEGPKRPGRIFVEKVVSTLDAPAAMFDFAASWGEGFALGDGGSHASGPLAPGAYTVNEALPADWEMESVVCETVPGAAVDYEVLPSGVLVNVADSQVVTCTFTNRYEEEEEEGPDGSLTIIKKTLPAGGEGFEFDAGPLGTFALDDGGIQTFTELEAGPYTVTETPAEGWEFASVECDALDYEADGASVTVNLTEGEVAVCTFTNGELPYTGSTLWLPLLLAGLAALLGGLGAWTLSWMREAEKA